MSVDVQRLTRAGIRAIEKDLESELLEKRREIRQLESAIETLSELAEGDPSVFPTEVAYTYTATRGKGEYVTKEEELLLEDPGSAEAAAKRLEKRLGRFGRLRDQMVERLKHRRKTVREAKSELKDFVHGTDGLVSEVLATLH